jgi:membrane protease YdiL (CAAX protease family)
MNVESFKAASPVRSGGKAALAFFGLSMVLLLVINVLAGLAACVLLLFEGNQLVLEVITQRMARPDILGTFSALQGAGLVGCAALVLRMWGYPLFVGFAFRRANWAAWSAALGVGASIGFFSGWTSQELVELIPGFDTGHFDFIRALLLDGPLLPRLPMFLAVVVVAPLAEEWVFRGAVWTFLEDSFGPLGALLGTTVLFSAYHLDPLHIVGILPTALFLGALRGLSGSVWPGVVAHAVNNALGVFAICVLSEETLTSTSQAGGALLVAGGALAVCLRWGRSERSVELGGEVDEAGRVP